MGMGILQKPLHKARKRPVTLGLARDLDVPLSAPRGGVGVREVFGLDARELRLAVFGDRFVQDAPVVGAGEARGVHGDVAAVVGGEEVGDVLYAAGPEFLGYEGEIVFDLVVLVSACVAVWRAIGLFLETVLLLGWGDWSAASAIGTEFDDGFEIMQSGYRMLDLNLGRQDARGGMGERGIAEHVGFLLLPSPERGCKGISGCTLEEPLLQVRRCCALRMRAEGGTTGPFLRLVYTVNILKQSLNDVSRISCM